MSASFFMAANSGKGFFSLFDEIHSPREGWKLYVIKGGPGTGKSSLMKKIAEISEEKRYFCERIFCSSDPDSLDGVVIPALKVSIADGTSPHIIEPKYPGVSEKIINLGECWDEKILKKNSEHIFTLIDCNKALHKQSSRYLSAASASLNDNANILTASFIADKADNFAVRSVNRYVECCNAYGKETRRFINAVTPKGVITLYDTALSLCDTVISVSDDYSYVSHLVINKIKNYALANGVDIISCLNPINPTGYPCHVILKNERVGFFTSDQYSAFKSFASRNINARRFVDDSVFKAHKRRVVFNAKIADNLINESVNILSKAKSVHDEIEKYYISAMNFNELNEILSKITDEIFG